MFIACKFIPDTEKLAVLVVERGRRMGNASAMGVAKILVTITMQ